MAVARVRETDPFAHGWRSVSSSHSVQQSIDDLLHLAAEQYYRLILIVGQAGFGKTKMLQDLSARYSFPYVNVNLELSRRLLHLNTRQRSLRVLPELEELTAQNPGTVLLDNLEMLFDPALQINPLSGLQRMSRNTTIVAAWNGMIVNGQI